MKRSVKVERLYSLGNYKNIKFVDEITDIDEEKALNPVFMGNLFRALMISCDLRYKEYEKSLEEYVKAGYGTTDDVIEALSDEYEEALKFLNFETVQE